MKIPFLLLLAAIAAAALACGDDDDGASSELIEQVADVCTETDEAADDDIILVEQPQPGAEIAGTLEVEGEIAAFEGTVWISVVTADGEHLVDAPRMTSDIESEELTPFEAEFAVQVLEETPACVWVYRQNAADPPEAVRIPVVLEPAP